MSIPTIEAATAQSAFWRRSAPTCGTRRSRPRAARKARVTVFDWSQVLTVRGEARHRADVGGRAEDAHLGPLGDDLLGDAPVVVGRGLPALAGDVVGIGGRQPSGQAVAPLRVQVDLRGVRRRNPRPGAGELRTSAVMSRPSSSAAARGSGPRSSPAPRSAGSPCPRDSRRPGACAGGRCRDAT